MGNIKHQRNVKVEAKKVPTPKVDKKPKKEKEESK
jgi:hypothetical protein